MKIQYTSLALILVLIGSADVASQRKAAPRSAKPAAAERRIPPYQLYLKIDDDANLSVSIATPSRSAGEISPGDLIHLIADLPSGGDKANPPNNVFPKVVVEASPKIAMIDFWNPITLFRLDRTEFSVILPGGPTLSIPPTPKSDPTEIKSDPLVLRVEIDEASKLSLNGEPAGTLSDTKPLEEFLTRIFKSRETNGVFHPETNDVETEVTIIMPMGPRKFSDLITVANAVKVAGAKWINLAMNGPQTLVIEEVLPGFTPIPPKKKGNPR